MIDNDKKKDKYYDEFRVIVDTPYYKYLAHPNKKHFLIAIKGGGIEKFIMNCAEEVDYTHPLLRDLDRLKSVSKSMNSNPDLKNILNTLIQRKATALMEIQGILQKHI